MGRKKLAGKKAFAVIIALTVLFSIFALSGCGIERRPAPTQPAPAPAPAPVQPAQDTQRSQMIAEKISNMEEINSATVVLANNSAWVGVDMKASTTPTMTNELKNKITDMVKTEDKAVQTVYVTADADTVTRLRNMAQDIASGRPVSGFIQELTEIGRRITPTVK